MFTNDSKIGSRNIRGRCPNHPHQQIMKGCLTRAEYPAGVVPNAPATFGMMDDGVGA